MRAALSVGADAVERPPDGKYVTAGPGRLSLCAMVSMVEAPAEACAKTCCGEVSLVGLLLPHSVTKSGILDRPTDRRRS